MRSRRKIAINQIPHVCMDAMRNSGVKYLALGIFLQIPVNVTALFLVLFAPGAIKLVIFLTILSIIFIWRSIYLKRHPERSIVAQSILRQAGYPNDLSMLIPICQDIRKDFENRKPSLSKYLVVGEEWILLGDYSHQQQKGLEKYFIKISDLIGFSLDERVSEGFSSFRLGEKKAKSFLTLYGLQGDNVITNIILENTELGCMYDTLAELFPQLPNIRSKTLEWEIAKRTTITAFEREMAALRKERIGK